MHHILISARVFYDIRPSRPVIGELRAWTTEPPNYALSNNPQEYQDLCTTDKQGPCKTRSSFWKAKPASLARWAVVSGYVGSVQCIGNLMSESIFTNPKPGVCLSGDQQKNKPFHTAKSPGSTAQDSPPTDIKVYKSRLKLKRWYHQQ